MNYDFWKILLDAGSLALAGIAFAVSIYTWNRNRDRASKQEIHEEIAQVDDRVDAVRDRLEQEARDRAAAMAEQAQRLGAIEEALKHQVSRVDIEKVHDRISVIKTDISETKSGVAAVQASLEGLIRNVDLLSRAERKS